MLFLHENTKRFLIFYSHEIDVNFIIHVDPKIGRPIIDLISLVAPLELSCDNPVEKRWSVISYIYIYIFSCGLYLPMSVFCNVLFTVYIVFESV